MAIRINDPVVSQQPSEPDPRLRQRTQVRYTYANACRAVMIATTLAAIVVMAVAVFLLLAWGGSPDKTGGGVYAAWVLIGGALVALAGVVADVISRSTQAQAWELDMRRRYEENAQSKDEGAAE